MSKKTQLPVASSKIDSVSNLINSASDYAASISIDLTAPINERWQAAMKQDESQKRHFAAHGLLLHSINYEMEHGEFLKELERRGFEQRQAYRAMTYAKFVFSRPKKEQQMFLEMPRTQVYALAQVDTDIVDQLVVDGDGVVSHTNVRALLNELSAVKANQSKMQTALNDAETMLAVATNKKRIGDLKPATHVVREEALANVGTVQYGFAGLQKLWDEVDAEFVDTPEHLLRLETLWFAMHGAVSFGLKTLAHIAANAPTGMPTEITTAHILTPEEADHWAQEWQTISLGFKHKEAQRHDARVAEQPRGRGRPAGNKTKSGAGA